MWDVHCLPNAAKIPVITKIKNTYISKSSEIYVFYFWSKSYKLVTFVFERIFKIIGARMVVMIISGIIYAPLYTTE